MGDHYECHCDPLTALEIAAEEGELDVCKFIIENAKEETLPAFDQSHQDIFYDIRGKVLKLLSDFYQDKENTTYLYFAEFCSADKLGWWQINVNYEEIYTYLEEFEKWNDDRIYMYLEDFEKWTNGLFPEND